MGNSDWFTLLKYFIKLVTIYAPLYIKLRRSRDGTDVRSCVRSSFVRASRAVHRSPTENYSARFVNYLIWWVRDRVWVVVRFWIRVRVGARVRVGVGLVRG